MEATASTRYSGHIAIIDLAGRLSLAEGLGVMRDAIRQEVQSGYKHILLNLAGVTYIDSAGLGEMASTYITLTGRGGMVRLVHARDKVQSLLRLTRLSTLLVAYTDESEALGSFGARQAPSPGS